MEALRAAVARGLHVANAWAIVRLCHQLLKDDDLDSPIVVLAIQSVVARYASNQDGRPVDGDEAELTDAHLSSAIIEVLDAVATNSRTQVLDALNRLARVHADTL